MEDSCHGGGRGGGRKKRRVRMLEKAGRKKERVEGEDIGTSEPHCRITRAGSCPESIKQPTPAAGRGANL